MRTRKTLRRPGYCSHCTTSASCVIETRVPSGVSFLWQPEHVAPYMNYALKPTLLFDVDHAAAAIGYCDAFVTEGSCALCCSGATSV